MKNLIILISVSIIFTSCGGADNDTVEIDGVLPGEHRVFITKNGSIEADFNSSGLSGLAGADRLCDTYAQAAGLTKDYKAILSDNDATAKSRLIFTGSVYTVTGSIKTQVAESSVELWNSDTVDILSKIDWDEDGTSVSSGNVWTGTTSSGTSDPNNCDNWTDVTSTFKGGYGDVNQTGQTWIEDGLGQSCALTAHLYCISQ
jgi:hypothetical protein